MAFSVADGERDGPERRRNAVQDMEDSQMAKPLTVPATKRKPGECDCEALRATTIKIALADGHERDRLEEIFDESDWCGVFNESDWCRLCRFRCYSLS